LHSARTRSPYFREVIEAGAAEAALDGTPPHALGLPVLTKAVIHERLNDLVAEGLAVPGRPVADSAGDSNEQPTRFYIDPGTQPLRKAVEIRIRQWLGVPIGERAAILLGGYVENRPSGTVRERLRRLLARSCALDAYDLGEARMADHLVTLRAFGPRLLMGYPSALIRFGEWCAAEGQRIFSLRAIVTFAETLNEDRRVRIAETLHAPVYDRYGCREVGCIAHERPGAHGLIVNADRVLIELLDERGKPVPEGGLGSVHVTDLDSHRLPLIRYEIGDLAIAVPRPDGQAYPALAQVEAHDRDVVRTPHGRAVGGIFWTVLLRSQPAFREFQVSQESLDRLRILYLRDPAVSQPDFQYFRNDIRRTWGEAVEVEFEEVDRIPPGPGGKLQIVRSLMPPIVADR